MEKLLTICTAAYNAEKYIDKMLSSLMAVKRKNVMEIIVVNDGSKDNTLKILKDYETEFPDIIKVIDKPNGGSGSARNKAFEVASGKYLRIIDADDWVDTEAMDAFLEKLEDIEADVVLNPFYIYDEKKDCIIERIGNDKLVEGRIFFPEKEFLDIDKLSMHGMTYRTAVIKDNNIRLSEGISYVDIEYIVLPMPYVKTIAYISNEVYIYRIGVEGQSIDPKVSIKKNMHRIQVANRCISELRKHKEIPETNMEIMKIKIGGLYSDAINCYLTDSFLHRKDIKQVDGMLKSFDEKVYHQVGKGWKYVILRHTDYFGCYLIQLLIHLKHFLKKLGGN